MDKQIIGMIHLKALPLSPHSVLSIEEIYEVAKEDLISLQENGATAAIIENFNDIPYSLENDKIQLYAMCNIATRLKQIAKIPLGLNIQFNCAEDELAMATACDLDFIRVEAYVENRVGVFGVTDAKAPIVERLRKAYNSHVKIYVDINVKHTYPLVKEVTIEDSISEALESGADAIIITGIKTGENPKLEDVIKVRNYNHDIKLILGSGINQNNILDYYDYIDGAIIGTSFKKEENVFNQIDGFRVKQFMDIIDKRNTQ